MTTRKKTSKVHLNRWRIFCNLAEGGQPLADQLFQILASKQSCVPPMPNQSKHPYRSIHIARKYELALDPLLSKAAI